jgi:putative endonuclease
VSADARQELGLAGEQLASEHLVRCGFRILERNYRTRHGELDIIAFDGQVLVFCEVKARRLPATSTLPLEAIDPRKRRQVRRMAGHWLAERHDRPWAQEIRFDAIGVCFDRHARLLELEHLEGVF